jgi:hypothetical protein
LFRELYGGDVLWSEAQTHIGENTGNADTRIMVETK